MDNTIKHAFSSKNQQDFEHIIHYTYDTVGKEEILSVHG